MSGHSLPSPAISLLILSLLIPFSLFIRSSEACGNSVYWGQNVSEGSLRAACSNPYPYYKYIVIAFLTSYGGVPDLNLDRHCDTSLGNCKKFASEIEYCQSQGIKVLLSVDGTFGKNSPSTANQLAQYLYDAFLHGLPGPLGKVALDGIDFYIDRRGSTEFWVALAKALSQYTTPKGKVHLSASPQCRLDFNQVGAIGTGLIDYVWVQFYNNPSCDITTGVSGLVEVWNDWSSLLSQISPDSQLFMGLPASSEVDSGGYIDPNVLVPEILPVLRNTSNYGGLMLWNRYYDVKNSYSPRVVVPACTGPPAPPPTVIPIPPREDLVLAEV